MSARQDQNQLEDRHKARRSGEVVSEPLDAVPTAVTASVQRALGRSPAVHVPESFAARVSALAVAQPRTRHSGWAGWAGWAGFGPRIALASAIAVTVAMFAFAPHASPSFTDLHFDIELVLLAELGGMAWWFGLQLPRD